jgi:hypothetical protein
MFSYQYDSTLFINAIQIIPSDIQDKITTSNITSATISYINKSITLNNTIIEIFFSNELNTNDKSILDTIITNFTDIPNGLMCSIKDMKLPGTNGGTFEKDTWITRDLNVIEGNVSFVTLSNNIVTIDIGTYIIDIKAPSCDAQSNQIRLRNITESTYILGTNAYSTSGLMTTSNLYDHFIFTEITEFDIQHICSAESKNIGLGRAVGYGSNEIYTTIFIQKIN